MGRVRVAGEGLVVVDGASRKMSLWAPAGRDKDRADFRPIPLEALCNAATYLDGIPFLHCTQVI